MDTEGGRLRGTAVERVGGEARTLILIDRTEPAGKGEQLRLQMAAEQVDVAVVRAHRDLQCGASHQVHRAWPIRAGWVVPDLDRQQSVGERPDLNRVPQHPPAEKRDADPTLIGLRDNFVRHRGLERRLQLAERALRPDLLEAEDVRLLLVDHRPQRLDLRLQLALGLGPVLGADVEQVLDVPAHHLELRHLWPPLRLGRKSRGAGLLPQRRDTATPTDRNRPDKRMTPRLPLA